MTRMLGMLTLTMVAITQATQTAADLTLLAPNHRAFVLPTGSDYPEIAEFMTEELRTWGRWMIVAEKTDAELIVVLERSGSGSMGRGSLVARLEDPQGKLL